MYLLKNEEGETVAKDTSYYEIIKKKNKLMAKGEKVKLIDDSEDAKKVNMFDKDKIENALKQMAKKGLINPDGIVKVMSEEVKNARKGFRMGYAAAISDTVEMLSTMLEEEGGEILFQRDIYMKKFQEFISPEAVTERVIELQKVIK